MKKLFFFYPSIRYWRGFFVGDLIMPTKQDKVNELGKIKTLFVDGIVAVVADLTGYTVHEFTQFRRALRQSKTSCKVVKNTLVKLATKSTHFESVDKFAKGSSTIIVGYEDPVATAKSVVDYLKNLKKGSIKGGVLDRNILTSDDIKGLAELPSKEVLLSGIMAGLNSGAQGIASSLDSVIRDIALLSYEVAKKNADS